MHSRTTGLTIGCRGPRRAAIHTADAQGSAAAEWRAHWPVVLAAAGGMSLSSLISYSTALFIVPLQADFGWTRAEVTSGQVIVSVAAVLFGPVIGGIIDRMGPRRIGIMACFAMWIGMALLSVTSGDIWVWRALWAVLAIAIVLIQPTVWTSAITQLFSAGRGLALALALCGSGISSLIVPKLAYSLIEAYGWRTAMAVLPTMWAVVVIPLIFFFFRTPRDGRSRSKATVETAAKLAVADTEGAASWRDQAFTPRFFLLAVAGFIFATVAVTLVVSVVPLLAGYGLTQGEAAGIAGLTGIAAICGRLTIGMLLDRLPARFVAAACTCLPMLGISLLLFGHGSPLVGAAAVVVFGLSLGAELDILAYLTSRYFRPGNFGLLFGIMGGFVTLGGGVGPVMLNAVYDATGSYNPALIAALPAAVVAALFFLLMGPYPDLGAAGQAQPQRSH